MIVDSRTHKVIYRETGKAPKKTFAEKRKDILEFCLDEGRTITDLARCCGYLSGPLEGKNRELVNSLISEGLLSRERKDYRSPRGFDAYCLLHQTTEDGRLYLDPSFQRKQRQARTQHKCSCGTFIKKCDKLCSKCFGKLSAGDQAEEQARLLKDQLVKEFLASRHRRINV